MITVCLPIYVRYPTSSPIKIQIGDLVEVQMSIIAVPVKGRESKLTTLLRSVTLMDRTYTQVSQLNVYEIN